MTLTQAIEMNKETKFSMIKHVAIYLRISDVKKIKGKRITKEETLEIHRERLIEFCERNGFTYDIYWEILSGKKDLNERKELNAVLQNLKKYDAIVVNEVSRLARNTEIAGAIKNTLDRFDKMLLTPEHSYWMRDTNDAMVFGIGAVIVEHERNMIAKRIKNDKITLSSQGFNASGSVPLGYYRDANTKLPVIDTKTAHIPREAFDLVLGGWGAKKIANHFNEKGYKTAKGNAFTIRAIKDLLKTETYKGTLVYNNVQKVSTTDVNGMEITIHTKHEAVRREGVYPAIVDPEVWEAAQDVRAKRSEKYGQGREKPTYNQAPCTLKDLVYCQYCKKKMRIIFDERKGKYMIRNCIELSSLDGSKCPNCGFLVENVEPKLFEALFEKEKELEAEIKELKTDKKDKVDEKNAEEKKRLDQLVADLEAEAMQIAEAEFNLLLNPVNKDVMEKLIQKKKEENASKRASAQKALDKINDRILQPKVEEEIKRRLNVILAIQKIKKEEDSEKINNFLKQFIYRIHYDRNMPPEIRSLGTKDKRRSQWEAKIKVEFI
jgi:site-specific DNA recombinase